MAVASLRRRIGQTEIQNKERRLREELRERGANEKPVEISEEDHKKRLELLKNLGILKE